MLTLQFFKILMWKKLETHNKRDKKWSVTAVLLDVVPLIQELWLQFSSRDEEQDPEI